VVVIASMEVPLIPLPIGTVIRLKKTNEFARITGYCCLTAGTFYNYYMEVEDRKGTFALFEKNNPFEVECLPNTIADENKGLAREHQPQTR
jgi:hypothetical protein